MKFFVAIAFALSALFAYFSQNVPAKPARIATENGFAVLELFTSQGCNSCPAADKLLAQTLQKAQASRQKVIALAYHVDYWDRLGWQDPYSHKVWTERQYAYGKWFKSQSVYTPQLVLNGQEEFVGSDKNRLEKSLSKVLQLPEQASITLTELKWDSQKAEGNISLGGNYAQADVRVVLLSHHTENHIPRGENAGITLSGTHVVRALQTYPAAKLLHFSLDVPPDLKKENAVVVAFVQHQQSHQITGAQQSNF